VEAAVLDEDAARVLARGGGTRDEEPWHRRLERGRVVLGDERLGIDERTRFQQQRRIGGVARQQEDRVRLDLVAPKDGLDDDRVPRISTTFVSKRAGIAFSLMRFSMSGLIQYFTESEMAGPRCTSVTRAPAR
jgi:hypothetical protein